MDEVTDAGKGAYVFVDRPAEAHRMFEDGFVPNMMVAARNVQMELTLPWYFGIKEFHGEEYSKDPAEIEPQHLAPNDAMSFHQIIQSCGGATIYESDSVKAKATYQDPITLEEHTSELTVPIGDLVSANATQLHKGDVIVAYAQSFIVIGDRWEQGDHEGAQKIAHDMVDWLQLAVDALEDPEVQEMHDIMAAYSDVVDGLGG
jgi:Ca-activated chloride channel family protein